MSEVEELQRDLDRLFAELSDEHDRVKAQRDEARELLEKAALWAHQQHAPIATFGYEVCPDYPCKPIHLFLRRG